MKTIITTASVFLISVCGYSQTNVESSYSSTTTMGNAFPRVGAVNTNPTQGNYNVSEIYTSAGNGAVSGGIVATYSSSPDAWIPALKIRTTTNHPILFETNGVERMRLDASGSLGIGTTSFPYGGSPEVNIKAVNSANAAGIGLQSFDGTSSLYLRSGIGGDGQLVAFRNNLILGSTTGTGTAGFVERARFNADGTATLTGALTGTSATFKGLSQYDGIVNIDNTSTTGGGILAIKQNGVTSGFLSVAGSAVGNTDRNLALYAEAGLGFNLYTNGSPVPVLQVVSNGNTTFTAAITGLSATMGLAQTSTWGVNSAFARFGHSDYNSSIQSYGFLQQSNGDVFMAGANTYVASPLGKVIMQENGGSVAIGTSDPKGYKLAVAGNVIAESIKVALQGNWPDYVFKSSNKLRSLSEVEKFVQENNHLPEMPSEAEVKKDGIDLGQMDVKLLKKIEELTLYMIDMNKTVGELKQENQSLKKKVAQLEEAKK